MLDVLPTNPTPADDIEAALRYLIHFESAFQHGATVVYPSGSTLFIPPEAVCAAVQARAA